MWCIPLLHRWCFPAAPLEKEGSLLELGICVRSDRERECKLRNKANEAQWSACYHYITRVSHTGLTVKMIKQKLIDVMKMEMDNRPPLERH